MLVSQISRGGEAIEVVARDGPEAYIVKDAASLLDLVEEAMESGISLIACLVRHGFGAPVDLPQEYNDGTILLPIHHPDPAHMHLTWATQAPPAIAGVYVISKDGTPFRVGFALGNKLPGMFGPEILVGELPVDIRGTSRILREGKVFCEKPFATGKTGMSHTLTSLEDHHFKRRDSCQPGDVHVHLFGGAAMPASDDAMLQPGDVIEVQSPIFGLPLRNILHEVPAQNKAKQVPVL